jgi:putative ABC transport system permease protein
MLHKLRSFLAILGILIGITAVIWLVALGEGVSYQAQQQIKDLGANNVIVISKKPTETAKGNTRTFYLAYGLLRSDYRRIVGNLGSDIKQIARIREKPQEFRNGPHTCEGRLVGCTEEYLDLNRLVVEKPGRFLKDADGAVDAQNFCVLGSETAARIFPLESPLNKSIQIDQDFYRVVGVTKFREASAAIGGSLNSQDYNLDVYIPIETFRARIGDMTRTSRTGSNEGEVVELNQITITVDSLDQVDETADIVRALLQKEHKDVIDYAIVVPKELLRQAKMFQIMFNILLVLIAGISLLVGGIGIMNIMLASVTERTREIGVRRALGARRSDIINQFLSEAIVLTGVGGVLGIGVGLSCKPAVWGMKWFLNAFFSEAMSTLPDIVQKLEPRIEWWPILISFIISVVVGVLAGMYPAIRAAYMDPIEALRHE